VAVESTVQSLDRLVTRFPRRDEAGGRRFDIREYSVAAQEFTRTAQELTQLLEALGREGLPLTDAVAKGVEAGQGVVDYLFWRALLLGLLLIASGFAAALGYRVIARRLDAQRQYPVERAASDK
jgi:hypothetical protein